MDMQNDFQIPYLVEYFQMLLNEDEHQILINLIYMMILTKYGLHRL